MAHDILLETGTNEVEFLEFYLNGQSFGVNVAKVKQLIRYEEDKLTRLPGTYDSVIGSLLHAGKNLPIVDLSKHLKRTPQDDVEHRIIIITDFNNAVTGFLVDGVNKIHRITWDRLQPVSSALEIHNPRITGVVLIEGQEVLVLDFEYILDDINPDRALRNLENPFDAVSDATGTEQNPDAPQPERPLRRRSQAKVLFADDSKLFRDCMMDNLRAAGFTSLTVFENGEELWNHITSLETVDDQVHLVLSDIEMPRMDGLTLCRKLKEKWPGLPVLMLSSLITEQMSIKCEGVGADANLSKKNLELLLTTMDRLAL